MEYLRINHSIMFLPLLDTFKWKNLCYMNSILQDRLDAIKELYKRYKVRSLYSFGSVNTPRFTEHSDIDLLIEFDPSISLEEYADNCFSLRARLVKLFKRKIDLVTNRSLSNPYFIADIEQGKQLLYGAL